MTMNKDIIVIFTEKGFVLDSEPMKEHNYYYEESLLI